MYGELGDGSFMQRGTATPIPGLTNVTQIAAGGEHTCALLSDTTVECWGWNQDNEIGDGSNTNRGAPVPVPGLTGVVKIIAGGENTCVLLTSGDVECWGNSSFGQCGSAAKTNPVPNPTAIVW
jgi:alpha-tubulin suppressor-like RCC1 family protein